MVHGMRPDAFQENVCSYLFRYLSGQAFTQCATIGGFHSIRLHRTTIGDQLHIYLLRALFHQVVYVLPNTKSIPIMNITRSDDCVSIWDPLPSAKRITRLKPSYKEYLSRFFLLYNVFVCRFCTLLISLVFH